MALAQKVGCALKIVYHILLHSNFLAACKNLWGRALPCSGFSSRLCGYLPNRQSGWSSALLAGRVANPRRIFNPPAAIICRAASVLIVLLACSFSLPAATYYLTIVGLGGAPEYDMEFAKWAADLDSELRQNGPGTHILALTGDDAKRGHIDAVFQRLAAEISPQDAFALMLIGHGTFDGADYKFNIPGPDITATQLAALLNRIPARRQLVVNMTSASGASIAALARKDRIVITATKSGTEKNATIFARYWIDALHDPAADTNKNGTVSALEAFRYANQKVAAYFDSEKLLATEHALLTDNGSAEAARDPGPGNGEGLLAASFPILRPPVESVQALSPKKQRLFARKQSLEAQIDRLKYQKAAMPEAEYRQQLTALLLDLARTQAEIDQ